MVLLLITLTEILGRFYDKQMYARSVYEGLLDINVLVFVAGPVVRTTPRTSPTLAQSLPGAILHS